MGSLGRAARPQLLPHEEPRCVWRRRRRRHDRRGTCGSACVSLRNGGQKDRYHHERRGREQPPRRDAGGPSAGGPRATSRRGPPADGSSRSVIRGASSGLGLVLPAEQPWAESRPPPLRRAAPRARGRHERPLRDGHRNAHPLPGPAPPSEGVRRRSEAGRVCSPSPKEPATRSSRFRSTRSFDGRAGRPGHRGGRGRSSRRSRRGGPS